MAPRISQRPLVKQSADSLLVQLEVQAQPTPGVSWFFDNKDMQELENKYTLRTERKSLDTYLLTMEFKVSDLIQFS